MADESPTPCKNALLFPEVLKRVFQCFNARELRTVSSVCQLWKSQADHVLCRRQQYSWQLFENKFMSHSCGTDSNSACRPVKSVFSQIEDYFKNLSIVPKTAVVFITKHAWRENKFWHKKKEPRAKRSRTEYTPISLPKKCSVVYSVSPGIIGTSSDLSRTVEKELETAAAVMCFGNQPGVDVSLWDLQNDIRDIQKAVDSVEPRLKDLKLALMMAPDCQGSSKTLEMFRAQNPLIVGGLNERSYFNYHHRIIGPDLPEVLSQYTCLKRISPMRCSYTLFCGSGIQLVCVHLGEEVDTKEEVEKSILRLKEKAKDLPMQNTVAFMFACVARGVERYGENSVECTAFRKHFPTTPILGFFGNGEIGCEHPSDPELCDSMNHGYSTFIVLISMP